jgi:hypothetical protein
MRGLIAKIYKPKKRRKGRHSKNMSTNKSSKNYVKPYAKQGR